MRIGIITPYHINEKPYGIEILNIFPERIVYNYRTNAYKYYGTEYYVKFMGRVWFMADYNISSIIYERKKICERTKSIAKSILNNVFAY